MYPVTFFKTTIPNKHKHINKILVEFHWTQRRKSPVCRSLHKHLLFMSCPALSGGVLLFVYGVLLPVQVVVCCCCQPKHYACGEAHEGKRRRYTEQTDTHVSLNQWCV